MSILRSNCTNGVVPSGGMGFEKCWRRKLNFLEMKREVWLECHEWIELRMKRKVGELE